MICLRMIDLYQLKGSSYDDCAFDQTSIQLCICICNQQLKHYNIELIVSNLKSTNASCVANEFNNYLFLASTPIHQIQIGLSSIIRFHLMQIGE